NRAFNVFQQRALAVITLFRRSALLFFLERRYFQGTGLCLFSRGRRWLCLYIPRAETLQVLWFRYGCRQPFDSRLFPFALGLPSPDILCGFCTTTKYPLPPALLA